MKLLHHILSRLHSLYSFYRLKRHVRRVVRYGTVRDIRDLAEQFRRAGVMFGHPGAMACAARLDEEAEKIVLRRVFNKDIYED